MGLYNLTLSTFDTASKTYHDVDLKYYPRQYYGIILTEHVF
jgi:hypothetical protein